MEMRSTVSFLSVQEGSTTMAGVGMNESAHIGEQPKRKMGLPLGRSFARVHYFFVDLVLYDWSVRQR